jgi:hypothetical protein
MILLVDRYQLITVFFLFEAYGRIRTYTTEYIRIIYLCTSQARIRDYIAPQDAICELSIGKQAHIIMDIRFFYLIIPAIHSLALLPLSTPSHHLLLHLNFRCFADIVAGKAIQSSQARMGYLLKGREP